MESFWNILASCFVSLCSTVCNVAKEADRLAFFQLICVFVIFRVCYSVKMFFFFLFFKGRNLLFSSCFNITTLNGICFLRSSSLLLPTRFSSFTFAGSSFALKVVLNQSLPFLLFLIVSMDSSFSSTIIGCMDCIVSSTTISRLFLPVSTFQLHNR